MGFGERKTSPHLRCPKCNHPETVIQKSHTGRLEDYVSRDRECKACGHVFKTREYYDDIGLAEMKRTINMMYGKLDEMSKMFEAACRKIERA